MFQLLTAARVD